MERTRQGSLISKFTVFSEASGIFTFAVGCAVIAGWLFNIRVLKSLLPGLVTMKFNTALCFAMLGSSLVMLQKKWSRRKTKVIAYAAVSIVLVIASLTLYEYAQGVNTGIDQLLWKDDAGAVLTFQPGRMAATTALSFILLSLAILMLDVKTRRGLYPGQLLASVTCVLPILSLVGYLFGVKILLIGIKGFTAMALHTAITFLVLSLGVFFARPEKWFAGVFTSDTMGGAVARSLIPITLIIPPFLEWVRLLGENRGIISKEFGIAFTATATMAIISVSIIWMAALIKRTEEKRKHVESDQRMAAEILQVLNEADDLHLILREALRIIKKSTGFDAVGLRLRMGEDYPYYEQSGFSEEFILKENSICAKTADGKVMRDSAGRPILECTCWLVISGNVDYKMSCFTRGGSFWTNRSPEFLKLKPEEDPRTNPRNTCIYSGYNSIALIPLRAGNEIVGLLQLNDNREGRLTRKFVEFLEGVAMNIGLAIMRRETEDALSQSEVKMRSFMDNSPSLIFIKDIEGRYILTNRRCEELLGVKKGSLIGKTDYDIYPKEYARAYEAMDRKVIEAGSSIEEEEVVPTEGGDRYYLTVKFPIRDKSGKPYAVCGIASDVSDRKKAEKEADERRRELEVFYKSSIGREEKILELKQKVRDLEGEFRNR